MILLLKNMSYKIAIANESVWLKDASQLSKPELQQILLKIRELQNNPWPDGSATKRLKEDNLADFRLKIGDYRVLFDRDLAKKEVVLYRILHRSKVR